MNTDLEILDDGTAVSVTPLKTGGRFDWHVTSTPDTTGLPVAFVETDIVAQLRSFFDRLDAEAEARKDDPVAMVNVLARMEALLSDVRTVTATIRTHTAEALHANKIRRMTIDEIATVEGTSESERTDWQDERLMSDMIGKLDEAFVTRIETTGELPTREDFVREVLSWFRVQWRLTPIRDAGLNPDDYSQQPTDEDGKPMRTPTVRVHDNILRREGVTR